MQVDIELRNVEATSPLMRSLSRSDDAFTEERIELPGGGSILVAHQGADHRGAIKKPVLITYHDIGLNHVTNFQVSKLSWERPGNDQMAAMAYVYKIPGIDSRVFFVIRHSSTMVT